MEKNLHIFVRIYFSFIRFTFLVTEDSGATVHLFLPPPPLSRIAAFKSCSLLYSLFLVRKHLSSRHQILENSFLFLVTINFSFLWVSQFNKWYILLVDINR